MFNEDKTVAAAQKVMLEILVEIHRICVENDITYWLEAGTLLGAIRHKGFIPWDDDCDVSMPRKDYERFLQIAQEKLPETMFLQTKETDKEYPLPWAKIRKNGTLLIETGETGEEKYHHGIFVDIFPYDAGYVCLTTVDEVLPVEFAENIFEGHSFYIPNDYDKVLKANFGDDYMELPPVDQRKTHAKMIKI